MLNSGQICMSTERLIVQRGASKILIDKIVAILSNFKAGDLVDPTVKLSALFSDAGAANVVSMIEEAKNAGEVRRPKNVGG